MFSSLIYSVQYLDKHLPGGLPQGRGEDYAPYLTYRNSLVQGELDMSAYMPQPRLNAPHRGRGRPRKRPINEGKLYLKKKEETKNRNFACVIEKRAQWSNHENLRRTYPIN